MYEISLVPDVKSELLKKQKLRNLILLICVAVAGGCVALLVILGGIVGGQKLKISNIKNEISCRYEGGDNCKNYGTAIMKFENAEDLLTIQKQMESVGSLNGEKVKMSRIFGVLDVVLPNNERDQMTLSELSVDLLNWTIYFNAVAHSDNNVHSRAVQSFEKGIQMSYYDYGHYMRAGDGEGDYAEIPSYCVDEEVVDGYVFGVYHKGMPGCEENVVLVDGEKPTEKTDDEEKEADEEKEETESETGTESEEATAEGYDPVEEIRSKLPTGQYLYSENNKEYLVEDIYIRRTYKNNKDLNDYRSSTGDKIQKSLKGIPAEKRESKKGYYFESACLQYKDDEEGSIDEEATREQCPVLAEELLLGEPSVGRDSDGVLKQQIEANVPLSREIFLAKNSHMRVKGPSRQNVTDSYIQIRDMFSGELTPTENN